MVVLDVTDDRLDAAPSSVPFPFAGLHALSFLVGQVNLGTTQHCRCSLVPFVAVSMLGTPASDALCLMQRVLECVAVIRVAVDGLYSHDPTVFRGADQRNLAAELVLLVGLALGDAFNFRGLHAVELVAVTTLLSQDQLGPLQHGGQYS